MIDDFIIIGKDCGVTLITRTIVLSAGMYIYINRYSPYLPLWFAA